MKKKKILTKEELRELNLFNRLLSEAKAKTIEEIESFENEVHNPEARDKRRRFSVSVRCEARINLCDHCWYCGKLAPDGHADHVIPWSRGGRSSAANARWSCKSCNLSKGAKVE